MRIRKTLEKDLEQLPFLYRQNYNGDTKIETNFKGLIKEFKKLSKNEDYIFISALEKDKVIGFCYVVLNRDIFEQQKPMGLIWALRVLPEYRKQGVGKKIINYIEKHCKKQGVEITLLFCESENQPAIKFYNNIGFKEMFSMYKYL